MTTLPTLVDNYLFADRLAAILNHREPMELASEALSSLITDFGATAASLFHAVRPLLRARQGELSEALSAHMDQWEANVGQRIVSGPWKMAPKEDRPLASRPVKGTDQLVLCSLILSEQDVVGTICLAYPREDPPIENQRVLLANFMQAIGSALGLISQLSLTTERLTQLSLFYQVAQSMASTTELNKVLENSMQLATAVLDAAASAVMLIDEKSQELVKQWQIK